MTEEHDLSTLPDWAREELESLRAVCDQDLTFSDLEMRVRDGTVHLHVQGSEEGGSPALRVLAACVLNLILGPDGEFPPNYRMVEWTLKPAGEVVPVRLIAEAVRQGGKSSHELRGTLEAEVGRLQGLVQRYESMVGHCPPERPDV